MRKALAACWRAVRYVVQDRHDAVTWLAITAVATGVTEEFGWGWASMAGGVLLFALAWKGMR